MDILTIVRNAKEQCRAYVPISFSAASLMNVEGENASEALGLELMILLNLLRRQLLYQPRKSGFVVAVQYI